MQSKLRRIYEAIKKSEFRTLDSLDMEHFESFLEESKLGSYSYKEKSQIFHHRIDLFPRNDLFDISAFRTFFEDVSRRIDITPDEESRPFVDKKGLHLGTLTYNEDFGKIITITPPVVFEAQSYFPDETLIKCYGHKGNSPKGKFDERRLHRSIELILSPSTKLTKSDRWNEWIKIRDWKIYEHE